MKTRLHNMGADERASHDSQTLPGSVRPGAYRALIMKEIGLEAKRIGLTNGIRSMGESNTATGERETPEHVQPCRLSPCCFCCGLLLVVLGLMVGCSWLLVVGRGWLVGSWLVDGSRLSVCL